MLALALGVWLGVAHASADPAWTSLPPWRTWVVLENVAEPMMWFVVDDLPGSEGRCEVGVPPHDWLGATVWCGPATRADNPTEPTSRRVRRAEHVARQALEAFAKGHEQELQTVPMRYLGSLRRVTLRQFVIVEPGPDAAHTLTHGLISHWDVDVESGWVGASPVPPKLGYQAACVDGVNPLCELPPRFVAYDPPIGWDGLLIDPREPAPGAEARELLKAQSLAIARAHADGDWVPAPQRAVEQGLLPSAYDAKAVVTMRVRIGQEDGSWEAVPIAVDVPLNVAAFRRFETRFPILSARAELELRMHIGAGYLDVRILPGRGEPVEHRLPVRCAPVIDGALAALATDCEVQSDGHALRWDAPWGGGMVVLVEERVEPLMMPAYGVTALP